MRRYLVAMKWAENEAYPTSVYVFAASKYEGMYEALRITGKSTREIAFIIPD